MTKKKEEATIEEKIEAEQAPESPVSHEFETKCRGALADYQSHEKRIERDKELLINLASSVLVIKLLPVLDNLERAQAHLQDSGLDHVIRQFKDALATEGVSEIGAEEDFNPEHHEAIAQGEGEEGKVLEVLEKGYKMGDRVLRPAKGKEGKGSWK